ncbi:MAG: hypothetical protein ING19_17190, partial [Azospirillum sp.]|nr:hypothetical protein [Azospirillum sp.]
MNSIAEVARGRTDDEFGRKLARTAIGKIYRAVDAAISSAVRLVVEPDMFSVIRENAIDRPSELLEFLPTIRTPYPALWIEWSPPPDLKPNWRAGENRTIPEKSGLLIRSKNADGTKFSIVSAWRHARTTQPFATTCPEIASMEAMFDSASKPNSDLEDPKMLRLLEEYRRKYRTHYGTSAGDFELRCERLVGAHFTTYPSPLYATHGFEDPILFSKIIPIGEAALDAARADALNDTRFLMAFLMFLNASNAVERLPRDFAPLNRQRVKSGKMPLYDHQIVRMRLSA